ncbi:hypothetical protein [Candidatus Hecatella orcuttiae]|jgi:hypothetical protein|uniref:hypothetical protein n=1 Tax=Candidatus Hecatella orcuttiae TaxID=1935119 RepID=UPI00286805EA|nr:hypothetical protein [Candidatus Hecatella orcuttiae]
MPESELHPKLNITDTTDSDIPPQLPQINISSNLIPSQTIRHDHYTHPKQPELKIEVSRGQKGSYGWTITYNGTDLDAIIEKIREADTKLREFFLTEG